MAPPTDIEIAVGALLGKEPLESKYYAYFDGAQPVVYSTEKLNAVFGDINARFTENWCAVVVNSVLHRLELRDLQVQDNEQLTKDLQAIRELSGLVDDEDMIHEDLCVTGEAFVLVEMDEAGIIQAYRNDPRNCYAHYYTDNPRKIRFAAKWWVQDDRKIRLNMYYEDRTEMYQASREFIPGERVNEKAFQPWETPIVDNPTGIVPMFHFRTNRRRPKSELESVIEPQDMLNKLLADMMVAAEFGAYAQRYVISQAGIEGLKNRPFGIWDLVASDGESQPTVAGQFPHTPLANYLDGINKVATDIGIITNTPKHYFFAQGGDPSGEALIAMEAPLNKKVGKIIRALAVTWRDIGAYLLLLANRAVPSQSIWANYAPPETVQPKTQAEIRKLNVEAGIPLDNVLRDEGWTEADLQQMHDDEANAQDRQASFVDAALARAQTNFDQGLNGNGRPQAPARA